jgi:hypothetical protein
MSMKVIALTSANEAAMQAVATQLLQAATAGRLQLSVLVGVTDAHEASAVYASGGELWRVGEDESKPELDAMIDRAIDDSSPDRLAAETATALRRFCTKQHIASGYTGAGASA